MFSIFACKHSLFDLLEQNGGKSAKKTVAFAWTERNILALCTSTTSECVVRSVVENDENVTGWKAESSVAHYE